LRFLWIIFVILLVLWLLFRLRLGIYAAFGETLRVDVLAGPFKIQVLPAKPKKKEKPKKKSEAKKKQKPTSGAEEPQSKKPKISLEDIKSAANALLPPLKRALERTRRSIRVKPLDFSITVGGEDDPASAAELYGYIHMGVWTGMPVLEQLLVIPDPHIHVGIDFQAQKTELHGEAGLTIRLGTLVAIAFGVGIPALKWFLQFKKKQQPAAADQTQAQKPAA